MPWAAWAILAMCRAWAEEDTGRKGRAAAAAAVAARRAARESGDSFGGLE